VREKVKSLKMAEKIYSVERKTPSIREYVESEYLKPDGKSQINVRLYEGLEIFEPLSVGRQLELNSDILSFIDMKLDTIPTLYPVRINFVGNLPDPETREKITALLYERFGVTLREKQLQLRKNGWKVAFLAAFGTIVLTVYFTLQILNLKQLFMEFLSIAGTFALWEAVDYGLLERNVFKLEKLDAIQANLAEITFGLEE
jgi:hypothetical protein